MSVRDLIPWGRSSGNQVPSVLRDGDRDPFLSLHREVNRLFDDVFRGRLEPALYRGSFRLQRRLAERGDLRRREGNQGDS
ncbi:hypothetical protein Brsp07_05179 [Brucella sp. NBRC 14130]